MQHHQNNLEALICSIEGMDGEEIGHNTGLVLSVIERALENLSILRQTDDIDDVTRIKDSALKALTGASTGAETYAYDTIVKAASERLAELEKVDGN